MDESNMMKLQRELEAEMKAHAYEDAIEVKKHTDPDQEELLEMHFSPSEPW